MNETPANSTDPRIEAALQEYLERLDRGEPVEREAFLARYPEIADSLRAFIAAEDELRKLAGDKASRESAALSTRSFAAHGQETVLPQSMAKRNTLSGGSELTGQFGRYRIIRALGKGAMGTVYLAEDTQIERQIALKTPHFTEDPTGEQMERFFREARAAGNLRHPHICPIHDFGQIDGKHFITMAYIEGRPLSAFIQPDKPQTERHILIVIRKLALALQAAHDKGIVHRDLKPANIMVDTSSEPIIMDFGLAQQVRRNEDVRLTQTGNILGTPAFMSPEQVEGEPDKIGPSTDQYSLGVILYELLTGELPFRGSVIAVMGQILTKEPPRPSQLRPDLDRRIEAVCLKMMAKTPSERFESMKAVADELAAILKSPAARTISKEQPASSPAQSSADRMRADVGASQVLKSLKQKAVTESDLASLEELARKCYSRRDFEQVIQIIERISEERRSAGLQALLEKARGKTDEIAFLICEIDEADRLNDRPTALKKAEDLRKIKPGHHRAREIQEKYSGYGEGGAARIGPVSQLTQYWSEGGWIPWSVLAFGLAVFAVMFGVVVIYLGKTAIVIDVQDPDIKVEIAAQGKAITITGPKEEKVYVEPGEQQLKITYAGLETLTKSFEIKKGQKRRVTVSIVDKKIAAQLEGEPLGGAPGTDKKDGNKHIGDRGTSGKAQEKANVAAKDVSPPLLAAPFDEATAKKGQESWSARLKTPVQSTNSIGMKLMLIPPGEFMMGSTPEQIEKLARLYPEFKKEFAAAEQPQHRVRISRPYYLGAHEVTRGEFAEFVRATSYKTEAERDGKGGSGFDLATNTNEVGKLNPKYNWRNTGFPQTDEYPVVNVSWNDAVAFCDWLSRKERRTYRLATEAEWEYACRAGTTTLFSSGDDPKSLVAVANLGGKADGYRFTAPVGSLRANAFGLHDMHGNVWEMCADWFAPDYYASSPDTDPTGPSIGQRRVWRGQTWDGGGPDVRSAHRDYIAPEKRGASTGFRIALSIAGAEPAAPSRTLASHSVEETRRTPAVGPNPNVATTASKISGRPFFVRGEWKIENDELVQPTLAAGHESCPLLVFGEDTLSNYDLALEAKKTGGDGDLGIYFHWLGPGHDREFYLAANKWINFSYRYSGRYGREDGNGKELSHSSNQWYSLKVEARGDTFRGYLDGVLQFEQSDARFTHGRICLYTWNATARFRRIKVTDPEGKVLLEGLPELPPSDAHHSGASPAHLIAPFDEAAAANAQQQWAKHLKISAELTNSIGMVLKVIPPGKFLMGSTPEEAKRALPLIQDEMFSPADRMEMVQAEMPQHTVWISRPFYVGKYEVTRGQFAEFVRATGYKTEAERDAGGTAGPAKPPRVFTKPPKGNWRDLGFPQDDNHPVANVTWNDAAAFCEWLSRKEGKTYRLPTEAEWEYACRAGTTTVFYCGDDPEALTQVGNVSDATKAKAYHGPIMIVKSSDGCLFTSPVGKFRPNNFGLYDMHGNVWEWCQDWFTEDYYATSPDVDPQGPPSGSTRAPAPWERRLAKDRCGLAGSFGLAGPEKGSIRTLRGGAWTDIVGATDYRSANRGRITPRDWGNGLGFRVAMSIDATAQSGSASMPSASSGQRDARPAADPDRRAAQAVLSLGGAITIRLNGGWRDIRPGQSLPDDAFLLTRIELHDKPQLTDADLEALEGIANLKHFGLSKAPRATDAVIARLHNSTELESFWFENANVGDAGMAHLERFTRLKSLGLRGTHVGDATLGHLEPLLQLEHLALGGTRITSAGLVHVRGLTQLAVLWLERTRVGDAGLVHLEHLSNLKHLTLFGTNVTGAGLAHLKGLTRLETLLLGGLKATDASLASLQGLTSLKSLWLDATRITDAGLGHLERLTELRELNLGGTRVTSAGLAHLEHLQKLEKLCLAGTHVTITGLVHLRGLTALKELDLSDTKVTAAGAEELKKSLPSCKIITKPIVPQNETIRRSRR